MTLRMAPIDHYGQVIRTDNSSTATLKPFNTSTTTLSGNSFVTALNGIYTFDRFMITS